MDGPIYPLALWAVLFSGCSPEGPHDGGGSLRTPVDAGRGTAIVDAGPEGPLHPGPGELLPPENGAQIATPRFMLAPGEEAFRCFHAELDATTPIAVSRFVSRTTAASHHFVVYQTGVSSAPPGTLDDHGCVGALDSQWVYAASEREGSLDLPPGVAIPFRESQPVDIDMHFFNASEAALDVGVTLNLEYATGEFARAGSLTSFDTSIQVPPNGEQTVSGTCAVPEGARFFAMSTHTHSRGTLATIERYAAGEVLEELVRTTDWEHPRVATFDEPFLRFAKGEVLRYSCSYENDRAETVGVGTSAVTDEMCVAIAYYFPAAAGSTLCKAP